MTLTPNPGAMRAHLNLFATSTEGLIEIKHETAPGKLNGWRRFGLDRIGAAVDYACAQTLRGHNVYVGAGLRRADIGPEARTKNADVISWPALFWDWDSLEASERGLKIAEAIGLPFHLVVRTGVVRNGGEPDLRIQAWTVMKEPCADAGRVTAAIKQGIARLGSDKSIHDPVRIMRLAGSTAYARKDGRVDEPVVLDVGRMSFDASLTLDESVAVIQKAPELAPARRIAKLARLPAQGNAPVGGIWRDSAEVRLFQADLAVGAEMNPACFALAQKAVHDGHADEVIVEAIDALLCAGDGAILRPDRTAELRQQLPELVARARASGGPSQATPYVPAAQDLEPVGDDDPAPPDVRERMFNEFAWCENSKRAIEIATGVMLDRTQLDARAYDVGLAGTSKSAWFIFLRGGHRRRNVAGLTFRPGDEGRIVPETLPGLTGECVNSWLPPARVLPEKVTDDEVEPFRDLVAFVIPDADERKTVLDWMAWVAQNPGLKPSYAIVLGSTFQGVGKDTMLQPLLAAVGVEYVSQVGADVLIKNFNGYLDRRKLLVIEEMETFTRRETHNLLKPLIAAPPHTLLVDRKHIEPYNIPNILACVFMTNEPGALKIGDGDRRYFVTWNRDRPLPPDYYNKVWAWMKAGGAEKAAAWLLARDVKAFDAKAPAPWTQAKGDMRKAARPPLEQWIEERIADEAEPFSTDIVCLQYVCARIAKLANAGKPVPPDRISALLVALGALPLGDRMRLGWKMPTIDTDRGRLFAVRRVDVYAGVLEAEGPDKIKALFKTQFEREQRWWGGSDAAHDFIGAAA